MDEDRPSVEGGSEDASTEQAFPEPAEAQRIGPYRLREMIGEGGMGDVWLAQQLAPVKRRVALKVIKPGMDSRQVVARFEAERQALALMDHPAVAKVFDAGAAPDGRPYFVMEYVKGIRITDYCDGNRLTTEERIELFLEVCEGVQHAHHKGIIHRDIKPSNVLVGVIDGKPMVKIIDFGVAKATAQSLTEESLHTQLGTVVGTPLYMSPEQAELTAVDIDTRTDVYSLGVLLYELLVGVLPFGRPRSNDISLDEIRRQIREEDPPKPSARIASMADEISEGSLHRRGTDLDGLRKSLHGDLDWIVMKALEKDRTRRYGSPAELAADIRRHLEHQPVLAGPPSAAYRLGKFVRRHRAGVAAGSLAILALLVGSTLATLGMIRAGRAERAAAQEAEAAKEVADFLVGLFEISDHKNPDSSAITARDLLARGTERVETELTDQPLMKARIMDTLGRVHRSLGLYDRAGELVEAALETRRRELGGEHASIGESLSNLGVVRFDQGRYEESRNLQRQALDILEVEFGPGSLEAAWSRYYLGIALVFLGEPDDGRKLLLAARAVFEERKGPTSVPLAFCINDLGISYAVAADYESAAALFEEALEVKKIVFQPDHPEVAGTANNLAYVYTLMEDYEKARPHAEYAVHQTESRLGPEHPDLAEHLHTLANLLHLTGELTAAREKLERALLIQQKTLDPGSPDLALTLHTLGAVCRNLDDFDAAEGYLREALAIRESADGPTAEVEETLNEYGALLRDRGRVAEAEQLEARALSLERQANAE